MSEKINELIEEIKHQTECDNYIINLEKEKPDIFDSKFGGLPYWPLDKEYPTNSKGDKLVLLAQINFNRNPMESPLPQNGLLQFFIENEEDMGMNFDNQIDQTKFRVVYHEEIDEKITEADLKKLDVPNPNEKEYEYLPIEKESKISFTKNVDYINEAVDNFNEVFCEVYKKVYGKDISGQWYFEVLSDEDSEKLCNELNKYEKNHKVLGYPVFTQSDPRDGKEYSEYDTLLLQIDTDENITFGDSGICNFFIPRKSLLEKDFSKVLYNWDCY